MTPETRARFKEWAIAYWKKNPKLLKSPDEFLAQGQQLAIAIYHTIPADGKFIKADAIAKNLKRETRQVTEILGLIKEPWNLKSSKSNKEGGYAK